MSFSSLGTIDVEEDMGTVYFTVERGGGNIGVVTVDWTTLPDSAISPGEYRTFIFKSTLPHLSLPLWEVKM